MTNVKLADLLNEHEEAKEILAKLNDWARATNLCDEAYQVAREQVVLIMLKRDPALFKQYSDQLASELYDEINAAK